MTFQTFKSIFAKRGRVLWNGRQYDAIGIKCVRHHGELVNTVLIATFDGRTVYWLAPKDVEEVKK